MFVTPNNFPTQNNHRIALFQPDLARTDFDRIEDIGADAIASARSAVDQLAHLPHATLKPIDGFFRTIRTSVDKRRILTEDFRHAALLVLNHLAQAKFSEDSNEDLDTLTRNLRDALNQSHRVRDLLASEKEIGLLRGIQE